MLERPQKPNWGEWTKAQELSHRVHMRDNAEVA